jgi:hypothetical protein
VFVVEFGVAVVWMYPEVVPVIPDQATFVALFALFEFVAKPTDSAD